MNPEIFSMFVQFSLLSKVAFLIFSFFHILFLIVIYSQVSSMDRVVKVSNASPVLKAVAISAIIFNASLFLIAVVIL